VADAPLSQTSASLLNRLRRDANDQSAWNEFVSRYGPRIHAWCRHWNLQEADAQDVTQIVLLQLAAKMRTFVYDPSRSFRAWLKTLARHAWSDFIADRQRTATASGDSRSLAALETVPARTDLEARLQEVFDLELLQLATDHVRERVEPHTWEAFRLTALEGLPGAEVALRLGMPVVSVFKAKSNVHKMLQGEIARLEEGGGG
jgi:RNA polymerase sigma-70 factor (ECF subfamily)